MIDQNGEDDTSFYQEFSKRTHSNHASDMSGLLGAIELPKSNDLVYLGEVFLKNDFLNNK